MRKLTILCLVLGTPLLGVAHPALIPMPREVTSGEGGRLPVGSFRERPMIHLKQAWNQFLLKIAYRKGDWKWMFPFIPVGDTTGLRDSSKLIPQ